MNLDSKLFDATLDLERVKVSVRTLVKLSRQEQSAIIRTLNEFGFLLLRSEHGEDRQELLALKELFGRAAPHPRADADGIVPISNARYVSGYLGSTPLEHKLHTDGAFLDIPEQLCSLQCVRNAREGGETLLASAGLAFERLRRRMPTKHLGLLRGDALTIVRKHQSSTQPVFRLNGEALGIKFRQNDGAAEVVEHPVAVEAFAELVAALEDPACQLRIKLEPGEILVLDNTAVLHGRTAFCANELREMRRLNFDGHGRLRAELELGFKVGVVIAQFVAVVLPILICTGIGFAWSRSAGPVDTRALVFLVANVGFPCLLLSSLDRPGLSIGMVAGVFLATALAVLAFALLGLVALRLLRMPVRRYLPSIMLPNSGNMGIPIAYLAFGEEALVYAVAFSTLIQVGHATLGVWFASGDITPASILRNPMIYALAVALGLIALGWSLPPPLRDVTRLLGGITVPLMLVMLGLSLAGLRLHETWRPLLLSLVRVWGGFAVGYGIAAGLGMEAVAAGTFAIQCGMPTAVLTYLLAKRYDGPVNEVAGMVLITTLLVLLSTPLFIQLLPRA